MRNFAVLLCFALAASAATDKLMDAIRHGDTTAVRTLLKTGAAANARDETGATALMNAAAFASVETMRALITAGADVNAANEAKSTALMWASADIDKVRLLLDKGADVNARSGLGQSALLLAARQTKNTATVKLLLSRGADPKAEDKDGTNLLQIAYGQKDATLLEAARSAGVTCTKAADLGNNPLLTVLESENPDLIASVMKLGADANEQVQVASTKMPVTALLVFAGAVPRVKMLLEQGADVNAKSDRGYTLLMLAAGAHRPSTAMVNLLLDKGADVNAQDNNGRTALDWALLQGETPVSRMLREHGAATTAKPFAAPASVSAPRTTRAALEAVFPKLQPISKAFFGKFACISCHDQSLPQVAVARAKERGIKVDAELASHPSKATMAMWTPVRDSLMQGNGDAVPGFVANVSYGLFGLAEEGFAPNRITEAAALCLARAQDEDGSWNLPDMRPPLGNGAIKFTALAVRDMTTYLPAGRREELKSRVAGARAYLIKEGANAKETQDLAFLVLGLEWAGASKDEIEGAKSRLLALQRADGGWGQLSTMPSDAYSTGQALHALHTGGVAATSATYQKGVQYLLRTQLEDGTWFVRSRAFGFQPYFDAGFPHETDQFISAAATSWAAIALTHVLEPEKKFVAQSH